MHRILLGLLIIGTVLCINACSSLGLLQPTPSPTPMCIGEVWSYAENVQTKIDIEPTLKITIAQDAPDLIHHTFYGSTVTIYGDGRVVYTSESSQVSGSTKSTSVEKQIPKDQLQQIITALEEANFYAITTGCGGSIVRVIDAPVLEISVEADGKVYEIKDNGECAVSHFDKYCDLGDQIDAILGIPW